MKTIFIAGSQGMVGSALVRRLSTNPENKILSRTRKELDLTDVNQVNAFFSSHDIDEVYLAAARVGGIGANSQYPANFIYENLCIQNNVIHAAFSSGIKKLLFLGSSCIYPRMAEQPMVEEALLTGKLEPTNEAYAIAKIAGIKMCESYNLQYGTDFRCVMPTNLYGPGDNFSEQDSHVIPALIKRFHDAKINKLSKVTIWGSGTPKREFMHVDDMAKACLFVMSLDKNRLGECVSQTQSHINIGTGEEFSIAHLAQKISNAVGFNGEITFDTSKPDGVPRKLMDTTLISGLGWASSVTFDEGIRHTYQWFMDNYSKIRL